MDGFLTEKIQGSDTTLYDYSCRGELLSVDLRDGRMIEYVHDPPGRRIAKKVEGVIVEKYLWDGLTRLLAVCGGNNALTMRFEYALARTPLSMVRSGATYYFAYDQVGSLRAVSSASGTVVKEVEYDTFGNILSDTNPSWTVPFGYADTASLTAIMGVIIMWRVIRSFRDRGSEDVFDGADTTAARGICPRSMWPIARRKLDQLNRVRDLLDLAIPPGNRLERLRGDRQGQHSIRINDQFRVCFRWQTGDAYDVEIADYH